MYRVLLICFCCVVQSPLSAQNSEQLPLLELATLWQQNQGLLETVKCRWDIVQWRAETMDAAIYGEPENVRGSATCVWVRHGNHQTIRITADPSQNPETRVTGEDGTTYGFRAFASKVQIMDGMLRLVSSGRSATIHLTGGDAVQARTPWTLTATPFEFISEPETVAVVTSSSPNVVTLRMNQPEGGTVVSEFDSLQGGIPVRSHYENALGHKTVVVLDAEQMTNGAWIPTRVRRIIANKSKPEELLVDQCSVTSIADSVDPVDPDLAIPFDAGTRINSPSIGNMAMTILERSQRIGPEDLSELVEDCEATKAYVREHGRSPFYRRDSPLPRSSSGVVTGICVAAATLVTVLWHRRRSTSSPEK